MTESCKHFRKNYLESFRIFFEVLQSGDIKKRPSFLYRINSVEVINMYYDFHLSNDIASSQTYYC